MEAGVIYIAIANTHEIKNFHWVVSHWSSKFAEICWNYVNKFDNRK